MSRTRELVGEDSLAPAGAQCVVLRLEALVVCAHSRLPDERHAPQRCSRVTAGVWRGSRRGAPAGLSQYQEARRTPSRMTPLFGECCGRRIRRTNPASFDPETANPRTNLGGSSIRTLGQPRKYDRTCRWAGVPELHSGSQMCIVNRGLALADDCLGRVCRSLLASRGHLQYCQDVRHVRLRNSLERHPLEQ